MTHDLVSLFSSDTVSTPPTKRFVFAVTVPHRDVKVQGQLQTSTLLKDTSAVSAFQLKDTLFNHFAAILQDNSACSTN